MLRCSLVVRFVGFYHAHKRFVLVSEKSLSNECLVLTSRHPICSWLSTFPWWALCEWMTKKKQQKYMTRSIYCIYWLSRRRLKGISVLIDCLSFSICWLFQLIWSFGALKPLQGKCSFYIGVIKSNREEDSYFSSWPNQVLQSADHVLNSVFIGSDAKSNIINTERDSYYFRKHICKLTSLKVQFLH